MKKMLTMILALTMVFTLAACGGEKAPETADVDLNAFYGQLAEKYDWVNGEEGDPSEFSEESIMMMDLTAEPEFLENYYPGLTAIPTKQLIAQATMISAVANEFVFAECESEEDAAKVAEILQGRITAQAEGGAWYPETMESWSQAQVITQGTFVALIAAQGNQEAVAADFNALFA